MPNKAPGPTETEMWVVLILGLGVCALVLFL